MLRLVGSVSYLVDDVSGLGQSASKYQVGTITEVKAHQAAEVAPLTPRALTFPSK